MGINQPAGSLNPESVGQNPVRKTRYYTPTDLITEWLHRKRNTRVEHGYNGDDCDNSGEKDIIS